MIDAHVHIVNFLQHLDDNAPCGTDAMTDELVVTFLSEMDALGVRDRLAPCGFDPTDLRAVEHVAGRWSEHEYVGKVRAMLGCSDREAARGCTTQNARRLWFP